MYIFRWLMKNPIIILVLYFLSIVAILYSMTGGGTSEDKSTSVAVTSEVQTAGAVDSSLPDAPTIEPSTLTSALVTGAESNEVETVITDASTESSTDSSTDTENQITDGDAQFSEMSTDELLLMAREAYWNNGLEESAQIYQKLISSNPDVIDYKGELGNVYWRQGFPKKAAALYAEISMPMIEQGNADRVANMVGFIGLFFPSKATEIHNKLQAGK